MGGATRIWLRPASFLAQALESCAATALAAISFAPCGDGAAASALTCGDARARPAQSLFPACFSCDGGATYYGESRRGRRQVGCVCICVRACARRSGIWRQRQRGGSRAGEAAGAEDSMKGRTHGRTGGRARNRDCLNGGRSSP